MSKLRNEIDYFANKQKELIELNEKNKELVAKFEEAAKQIPEYAEMHSHGEKTNRKYEEFKAEFKAKFGFCDGEPNSVVHIIEAIARCAAIEATT